MTVVDRIAEPDVPFLCRTLAAQCEERNRLLQPVVRRYGEDRSDNEPERLHASGLSTTRKGPVGLKRDLQDLYLLPSFVDMTWTLVNQADSALHDHEPLYAVCRCDSETAIPPRLSRSRTEWAAPLALIAAH
jgi:hypothetical protein